MSWELWEYLEVFTTGLNWPWLVLITEPAADPPTKARNYFISRDKDKRSKGNQANWFFTTRFYFTFPWPTPPSNKVVHLPFIFNGFPFGSKRAFMLQDIHLTNMHCWTPVLGEMHQYSGWASIGCHSITYDYCRSVRLIHPSGCCP